MKIDNMEKDKEKKVGKKIKEEKGSERKEVKKFVITLQFL